MALNEKPLTRLTGGHRKKTPTLKYAQGLLREGIANFNYNQVREALATYRALAKAPET